MPLTIDAVAAAFTEFEIHDELGPGGQKLAVMATKEGVTFALKIVKDPLDDPDSDLPERFRREIEAMQRIDSPRVVKIEAGPDTRDIGGATHLWYLERHYSGGTLKDKLESPLDCETVTRLTHDLFDGIEALWTQGQLVHRDVKPGNIVFDDDGGAVLLDLGIALHEDLSSLTEPFALSPRTPMYCAPEQLEPRGDKERPDFRTDLFLIGIVAFEALTGKHPFNPSRADDFFGRVHRGDIDRQALEDVDGCESLKTLIERLLRPRPNQRFRTIQRARESLEEATN